MRIRLSNLAMILPFLLATVAVVPAAQGAAEAHVLPTSVMPVVNGMVRSQVVLADGSIILGGSFDLAGNVHNVRKDLVKLDTNGFVKSDWNPYLKFVGDVHSLAVDDEDNIYVLASSSRGWLKEDLWRISGSTGEIDWAWSQASTPASIGEQIITGTDGNIYVAGRGKVTKIAKADGSTLATWEVDSEYPGISTIIALGDGTMVISGAFGAVNGVPATNIARINEADGAVIPGLDQVTVDGSIAAVAYDGNGSVFIAGSFGQVNGYARNSIAKLALGDGALDLGWAPEVNVYSNNIHLSVDASGDLYMGGRFSARRMDSTWQSNIAKISGTTGIVMDDWYTDFITHRSAETVSIMSMEVLANGGVAVGGVYDQVGSSLAGAWTILDPTDATPLITGPWPLFSKGDVRVIRARSDGTQYVGGTFTSVITALTGNTALYPATNLCKINADGNLDVNWLPGTDGAVNALELDRQGNVYVGGFFTKVKGVARNKLAKLHADGSVDAAWQPAVASGIVSDLLYDGLEESIYLVGSFTSVNGISRGRGARVSAGDATTLPWDPGADGGIMVVRGGAIGNTILLGGNFSNIGGQPTGSVATVDRSSGVVATEWAGAYQVSGEVRDLAVDERLNVFAAVNFPAEIVKLNGKDGSQNFDFVSPYLNNVCESVHVRGDVVYVAGMFSDVSGSTATHRGLVALDARNGMVLPSWQPGWLEDQVRTIVAGAGSVLLAGGRFTAQRASVGDDVSVAGYSPVQNEEVFFTGFDYRQ